MSEYQETWRQRSRNHDALIHVGYHRNNRERNRVIAQNPDTSCDRCNGEFPEGGRQKFEMFWGWYRRMTREFSERIAGETENLGAHSYSSVTRRAFNYLLALNDEIPDYGIERNDMGKLELNKNEAVYTLMESVRYRGKLNLNGMEIRVKIVEIFVYSEQFVVPIDKAEQWIKQSHEQRNSDNSEGESEILENNEELQYELENLTPEESEDEKVIEEKNEEVEEKGSEGTISVTEGYEEINDEFEKQVQRCQMCWEKGHSWDECPKLKKGVYEENGESEKGEQSEEVKDNNEETWKWEGYDLDEEVEKFRRDWKNGEGEEMDLNENLDINTEGFGLDENSDQNSETESENTEDTKSTTSNNSVINLENLFEEINMANNALTAQQAAAIFGVTFNGAYDALNNAGEAIGTRLTDVLAGVQASTTAVNNLTAAQNNKIGNIVSIPTFHGTDGEDPHEWLRLFEQGFEANGWQEGVNQARKMTLMAGHLRDGAADWYETARVGATRYAADPAALVNTDLKQRFLTQYSTQARRSQWTRELQGIKQGIGEKVEDYARRFRKLLLKATYGNALPAVYQVNNFINGLLPVLQYQTLITEPADLDAAVNRAKLLERATFQAELNLQGVNQQIRGNVVKETPIYKEMQKDVKDVKIDELTEQMKRMEAHMVNLARGRNTGMGNQRNNGQRNMQCRNCGRIGHMERECYRNQTCKRCNKKGHTERACREIVNYQGNYIENDQGYDYEGYYVENEGYNNNEYYDGYYNEYEYENNEFYEEYESYPALRSGKEHGKRYDPTQGYGETIGQQENREEVQQMKQQREQEQQRNQQVPEVQMKRTRILTDEQKRKMAQNRRVNNTCGNCGMKGHFMNECKAPRREGNAMLNRLRKEAGEYNLANDLLNTKASITMAQIYNEIPKQRDNLHQALRRGNSQ